MSNLIKHFPVMATNVLNKIGSLQYARPIKIADCNFGFGGHSHLILKSFSNALIQGYDLDQQIIAYYKLHYSQELQETQSKRLTITNQNFNTIAKTKVFNKFDVILADFGFNSYHLQAQRGFSWLKEEQLDMRYSHQSISCSQLINSYSQLELINILQRYGELRGAQHIAQAIIKSRPIKTTKQLRDSVLACFQQDKTRKIAQVFQAFRIATNNQLKDIQKLCESLQTCLEKNGLFICITFHSLQRDVIHRFVRQKNKFFSKVQTELPSQQETKVNSKSKSAKILSFRKI